MKRPAVQQVSESSSIPSPVEGIDSLNSLVSMSETSAVLMENWIPESYGCTIRKGFREHQTLPVTNPIETVFTAVSAIASSSVSGSEEKLYAAAGGSIYDITAAGGTPSVLVSGLGSNVRANRWQHIHLSNGSDSYTYCVNGNNDPVVIKYPATVTRLVAGDGITAWTVNNVNPNLFINVMTYKRMLWFVERDSSNAWYLAPGLLWGTIAKFDFGPWMTKGGFLVALATWAVDDASNSNARLVAITSAGEAIVFEGDDPTNFTTWLNLGTYYVSPPLGRRCFTKYGPDLLVFTHQGIVSAFDVSRGDHDLFESGNGAKIQRLLIEYAAAHGDKFGWDMLFVPRANQLILNIPSAVDTENFQIVLNTITKSWCKFVGQPSYTWTLYYDQPIFALESTIYEGQVGTRDMVNADGTGGQAITASCQQAFSYLGAPSQAKHLKMIKPTFIAGSNFTFKVAVNLDFSFEGIFGLVNPPTVLGSAWDTAKWDAVTSVWGGSSASRLAKQDWVGVGGIGHTVSIRLKVSATDDVLWVNTQFVYEVGGIV